MPSVIRARSSQDLCPADRHRALLFDWDGTLFDNHRFNFRAMAAGLLHFDIPITERWFLENSGFSARRIAQLAIARAERQIPVDAVLTARDEWALANIGQVPAVEPLMSLLRAPGPRAVGIVTGSELPSITPLLELHDLPSRLGALVTRDELSSGKPSPEGYLLAMSRLGNTDADEVLAYEDSDQGIEAALSARIDVVDVRDVVARVTDVDPHRPWTARSGSSGSPSGGP
jgi:HAD superfamily hydrolase (TIGR01509 family)